MWICEYADMWICGYVDMWICGYADMWLCGYVNMLICRYVDIRICWYVDMQICRYIRICGYPDMQVGQQLFSNFGILWSLIAFTWLEWPQSTDHLSTIFPMLKSCDLRSLLSFDPKSLSLSLVGNGHSQFALPSMCAHASMFLDGEILWSQITFTWFWSPPMIGDHFQKTA